MQRLPVKSQHASVRISRLRFLEPGAHVVDDLAGKARVPRCIGVLKRDTDCIPLGEISVVNSRSSNTTSSAMYPGA